MELTVKVYSITSNLPDSEKFGLISQMRRSAISIASNIAEGAGRNSSAEFIRFLVISNGSCYELETQVILAEKLNLITNVQDLLIELDELQKMNYKFQSYLKNNSNILKEPELNYELSQYSDLNTQY